jgi:hypothetical protein
MIDSKVIFKDAWDECVKDSIERSPNYKLEDYTPTGRAPAPYGKRTLDWWNDKGHEFVDRYVAWRDATRWDLWEYEPGKPAIELEINFSLPGDLRVKTFIDRVFVTTAGTPVITDIKTGRTPETPAQLGLYRCAIGAQYDVWIDWGCWWDASKGVHSGWLDLSAYTPERLAAEYAADVRAINIGYFPPRPANNCGSWCGVASHCPAVGGQEAGTIPAPVVP